MKPNKKLLLSVAIATGIFYAACRKTDSAVTPPPSNSVMEEKFFNTHRSNDATEKALISYLQRVNNQN
ncbi:MAG: hypothetical protein JST23_13145 [Bacteroidetes bacterium]|nr:hypothetical protein [Bacteroidota bacterium]